VESITGEPMPPVCPIWRAALRVTVGGSDRRVRRSVGDCNAVAIYKASRGTDRLAKPQRGEIPPEILSGCYPWTGGGRGVGR
jgi:hypothetical protein